MGLPGVGLPVRRQGRTRLRIVENPLSKIFFQHTLSYPPGIRAWKVVEVGNTQESVHPWRSGVSLVFRLPWSRTGWVLGVWLRTNTEIEFHEAVGVRPLGDARVA